MPLYVCECVCIFQAFLLFLIVVFIYFALLLSEAEVSWFLFIYWFFSSSEVNQAA